MIGEWFGYTGSVTSIIMKSIITGIQKKSWEIREKKKKIEKTTTVAIKKTRHLVNLPYKPGISN